MAEKKEVLSVRLDSSTKSKIEQNAEDLGLSVTDYIKKIVGEVQAKNKSPEGTALVTLDTSVFENLANVLSAIVKDSLPQTIEFTTPLVASAEREYLRKLEGLEPEEETTLTVEEEERLQALRSGIVVDVTDRLLLTHNSVAIGFEALTPVQQTMFKSMIEKRELNSSEKLPNLTNVFQKAIWEAFVKDSNSMYSKHLFKATYGMEYNEFEAVFKL